MQGLQEIGRWFSYIILNGLPATLFLTLVGLGIGFLLGLMIAFIRVYAPRPLKWIVSGYERIFRSIPILVLMFIFAIGTPQLFVWAGPGYVFAAVAIALALRSSAYQAGIFRSAILSVDKGQLFAAQSIGMSTIQANRHIVLPQAFRLAVPGWSNEYAVVIKDTSFAMAVGITEMNKLALNLQVEAPALMLPILFTLTIVYFCFTYPVTKFVGEYMTKKLKRLGLGGG